jgi:hypothetical protein
LVLPAVSWQPLYSTPVTLSLAANFDTGTNQFNVGIAGTAGDVNNWPAAESPDHAIDGFGQKYLNFAKTNTGFIVTPVGGQSLAKASRSGRQMTPRSAIRRRSPFMGPTKPSAGAGPFPLSSFTQITTGPWRFLHPVSRGETQPRSSTRTRRPLTLQTRLPIEATWSSFRT